MKWKMAPVRYLQKTFRPLERLRLPKFPGPAINSALIYFYDFGATVARPDLHRF
jgi:hypothetical protein